MALWQYVQGNANPNFYALWSNNQSANLENVTITVPDASACGATQLAFLPSLSFCQALPNATGMCCGQGLLSNTSITACYDNTTRSTCDSLSLQASYWQPGAYTYVWVANATCASACVGACPANAWCRHQTQ